MQRARSLREVELVPGLADAGDGVPHRAQVPDRLKALHEQLVREVVEGELGAVVVVERRRELAGVECCGQSCVASMLPRRPPFFSLLCFCDLAEGHATTSLLRRSRGRKAGKRQRVMRFVFEDEETKRREREKKRKNFSLSSSLSLFSPDLPSQEEKTASSPLK